MSSPAPADSVSSALGAFRVALNDPLLLLSFAVYLDRCSVAPLSLPVSSAYLMFWIQCERWLHEVSLAAETGATAACLHVMAALLTRYFGTAPTVSGS
jgi:hypothetical protein